VTDADADMDVQADSEECPEFGKGFDPTASECELCMQYYPHDYDECGRLCGASPEPVDPVEASSELPEADLRDEAHRVAADWDEKTARAAREPLPEADMLSRFAMRFLDMNRAVRLSKRVRVFMEVLMRGRPVTVLELLKEMHRLAPKLVERHSARRVREWLAVLMAVGVLERRDDNTYCLK
jgi:hypothetical protein